MTTKGDTMDRELLDSVVEFRTWLKSNDTHLRSYAPNEIAQLAITCGFKLDVICPGVMDQVAMIQRLMRFWESDLSGKWLALTEYESGLE
jgi:hypothetical protein